MPNQFDQEIDRRKTASEKFRCRETEDVSPLGVADMDFASPPEIIKRLQEILDMGIFGYTNPSFELSDLIRQKLLAEQAWRISPEDLVYLPGLVCALHAVCRLIEPGEEVLTFTPVYPPFLTAPAAMNRKLLSSPMVIKNNSWQLDLDQLGKKISSKSRLLLLCNPHNPTGRVFTRNELERLGQFCLKHDLLICADEIHSGLILDPDSRHLSLASLDPELTKRTITLISPSKTYNLAGIGGAAAIIPNPELRQRFQAAIRGIVPPPGIFGLAAMEAAYRWGKPWREKLIEYLRINRDLVVEKINQAPELSCLPPQATYLAWIDARQIKIEDLASHYLKRQVEIWDGAWFGMPGFFRLNFGCPRSQLQIGLNRITKS